MKKTIAKAVMSAMLPALALQLAYADVPSSITQRVPGKMNYQGYLQDVSGGYSYDNGVYTIDCRIYNSETGGTCLWGGRYRAYVKNGYFNIMLGDETSTQRLDNMADVTYPNAGDLWKALWGANDTDTTRYLGVTVHEDNYGNTIENPTEIMPRQELLTSPFAFRAQSAQYASEAKDDFTVGGNLTVNGTTTFSGTINAQSGTQQVGPIRASSTTVNLGNGYTSATADNRSSLPSSLYGVANYLYFYSYYSMNFKPTAGNVNFTVPSGYDMKVTGAGDFISDVPVNTIGGSGRTTIKGASTVINGSSINLQDSAGDQIYMYNGSISGKGNFHWHADNAGFATSPFRIKSVELTFSAGSNYATAQIEGDEDFCWIVGGHTTSSATLVDKNIRTLKAYKSSSKWYVRVDINESVSAISKMSVMVLGVNKDWCMYSP